MPKKLSKLSKKVEMESEESDFGEKTPKLQKTNLKQFQKPSSGLDLKNKSKTNTSNKGNQKKRMNKGLHADSEYREESQYDSSDIEEEKELKKQIKTKSIKDLSDSESEYVSSERISKQETKRVKKSTKNPIQKGTPIKVNLETKPSNKLVIQPGLSIENFEAREPEELQGDCIDFAQATAYIPSWIQEPNIRDSTGKYSNQEGYDPSTLYVPKDELQKMSKLLKQYWEIKAKNYDKLIAMKVWKFYYFYFNDAMVVSRIIDMKLTLQGKWTMTFFHESCLTRFAPKILEKGFKIIVVEQMEEVAKSKDELVRREICQVLTRGTYTENQELDYSSRFFMAIFEKDLRFGVAFVDTTTHEYYLGEFNDDQHKGNLRTLLCRMKPVEITYINKNITSDTLNMIKSMTNRPTLSEVKLKDLPSLESILEMLKKYFYDGNQKVIKYPGFLESIILTVEHETSTLSSLPVEEVQSEEGSTSFYLTMQALSISISYLESLLLAETVVSMGTFLPININLEKKSTLYLDNQALQNLEILEVSYMNALKESDSLFGYMDYTRTPFGKRLFKKWLTSPLMDPRQINDRLDAVEDLIKNSDIADFFQERISKVKDLERMVNYIYNLSNKQRMSAIYFEDFAKNRLSGFRNFLKELKLVEEHFEFFEDYVGNFKSKRLMQITMFKDVSIEEDLKHKNKQSPKKHSSKVEGCVPRIKQIVEELEKMVIEHDNLLIPAPGTNETCDQIIAKITEIKSYLNDFLEKQKKNFKSQDIHYVHVKHKYELEIPEELVRGLDKPKGWITTSKRKGYMRFHTPEIEHQLHKLYIQEADFQKILIPFICDYFKKFYDRNAYWKQIINAIAEIDCLCSLAKLASKMEIRCRPQILGTGEKQEFELMNMVHPMAAKTNSSFVPNDIITQDNKNIFLITGPNMGGKSTLLRQTCLAVIMAQTGSFVPASYFKFSVIDRIFTRIGASDRILEGKSTFFVEMEETYNIVTEASKNSLLIIDELGRGTSTYDGVAIAFSTLKFIAQNIQCLTLFATHYHILVEEFKLYKNIISYHMECEFNDHEDHLVFLYKFIKGVETKSHGIVIAKMSGMPQKLIEVAKQKALFMTQEKKNISSEKNLMERFNKAVQELSDIENGKEPNIEDLLSELSLLH